MKGFNMINRDDLLNDLRMYVIEVQFNKVNGEQRTMRCTLRPDLLPPKYNINEDHKFHRENTDVIAVWDILNNGWRSFRVDSVTYVQNVSHNY
jgi:WYL_2, Sm-like SH3 beta-barrel fold